MPLIGSIVLTLFLIKGSRVCFLPEITQKMWACLSSLSIIPKAQITVLPLPIIEDSSISTLGCLLSASSKANWLFLYLVWKAILILFLKSRNNLIIIIFAIFCI